VTIESKFTERELGGCSQFKPSKVTASDPRFVVDEPNKRFANCTSRHEQGSDLKPATQPLDAACRLTIPDRNRLPHWDLAPELFEPDVSALAPPCPFRSDTYEQVGELLEQQHRETVLADWIQQRIEQVCGGRAVPRSSSESNDVVAASFRRSGRPQCLNPVTKSRKSRLFSSRGAHGENELGCTPLDSF
jgi:hypothetical protein